MEQACSATGIMTDENGPASVLGGGVPASGSDTIAAGTMHLSGGSHVDLLGLAGMQFLGTGSLQVDFVDLSAVGPAGHTAGPISFADWQPSGPSLAAAGFDAAANRAAGTMLADFGSGAGDGAPSGAIQPNGSGRVGGASFADPGTPHTAPVIPPHTFP